MGALDPIAGISLEGYAELAAKMKDCGGDLEVCARIAQENGVDRGRWQAAMDGWNERMSNPATAGQVALAYMPLYQAALARTGAAASASFEDYIGMLAMLNFPSLGLERMYMHYGINVQDWSQISMYWVDKLTSDRALAERAGAMTEQIREQLKAGRLPPVGVGQKPQGVTGAEIVNAASAVSGLPPVQVGHPCLVLWEDGNQYPGTVQNAGKGQCLVRFGNGHEAWVENAKISAP